ncbi:hypothetical protein C8024_16755 [Sphingopyxis sp. BSNA05]|nr:hypothetical protein [Sphingopyxis sp. BSNA05]
MESYVDSHPLRGAFVANQLMRLADLISDQGELLLQDAGIEFPARAVSYILLIGERRKISTADIAKLLRQPHQVATQRVELLITSAIVERIADPQDGRRKILRLTPSGIEQFGRLQACLEKAARAFAGLFEEIECDMPAITRRATEALEQRSVLERVRAL